MDSENFVFYLVAFDPIEIQTCSAPQNDRQNLIFVKDVYEVGKKMTINGRKMGKRQGCLF